MIKKIAFICPPLQGHINPMSAIAFGLKSKKIVIKFIGVADMIDYLDGFDLIPMGTEVFPKGSIKTITDKMAKRKGMRMGRAWQSRFTNKWADVVCRELPQIIEREKIDFIVCDQLEPAVALVADYLKIPFVTICNAMAIVMDLTYPPFFTSWDYKITKTRLHINRGFYQVADFILKRDSRVLEKWRKEWGMEERIGMNRYFANSKLAILSQQTKSLEFPLTEINKDWFYCGPFRNSRFAPYILPDLPKDDKINVYISLGSIQGSRFKLFKKCIQACNALGLRAIVVHAGLLKAEQIKELEKDALVFDYVKQPDIFQYCKILISHCGLNTALDALSYGRPIIAIPMGIEQGAIATKLKRIGCAVVVKNPKKKNLQKALSEILSKPEYEQNYELVKQEIEASGGAEKAIDVIYNLVNNEDNYKRDIALSTPKIYEKVVNE